MTLLLWRILRLSQKTVTQFNLQTRGKQSAQLAQLSHALVQVHQRLKNVVLENRDAHRLFDTHDACPLDRLHFLRLEIGAALPRRGTGRGKDVERIIQISARLHLNTYRSGIVAPECSTKISKAAPRLALRAAIFSK
jgi:hypothetical protein